MRSQYSFVTSLYNLRVAQPIGANWTITGDLRISNTLAVSKRLVTDLLRANIGFLEADHILSGNPFVYALSEYPSEDTSEEKQMEILQALLIRTQLFVNMLWLVKDNAINAELGFLQYPYQTRDPARVSSNFLSSIYSDATGSRCEVTFEKVELRQAIELYRRFYGPSLELSGPEPCRSPLGKHDRLTRALYFLQAARAASYLPERVAYSCTCFESLVSTSASELAHQVAERVAILIGKDPDECVEIYRNLKRAYDTRSKLVHGGRLTRQEHWYVTDSVNCDSYLRRLLHVLLANRDLSDAIEQDENSVNEFFLKRLFESRMANGG